jgi:hypothetical protein
MKFKIRRILFLAFWILVSVFLSWKTYGFLTSVETPSSPGRPPETQVLHTLEGVTLEQFAAQISPEARIMITVLWDVNCQYCRQEIRWLEKEYAGNPGVVVIGINLFDSHEEVAQYIADNRLTTITMFVIEEPGPSQPVPNTRFINIQGDLIDELVGWDAQNSPDYVRSIVEGELR